MKNLVSGKTVGQSLYNSFEYFFDNLLFNDLEDPVEGSLMDIYDYNIYGDPALKWNFQYIEGENKSTFANSDVSINVSGSKNLEITLIIHDKENLFFLFPAKHILITSVSDKSAIIDNNFGIIRLNNVSDSIVIRAKVRGILQDSLIVQDSEGISSKKLNISGYDFRDFNFSGTVNTADFQMLVDSFGKTYMDLTFNHVCDLNFDHKVDGADLFIFLTR